MSDRSVLHLYLDDSQWPTDRLASVQAGKKHSQQKSFSVLCLVVIHHVTVYSTSIGSSN